MQAQPAQLAIPASRRHTHHTLPLTPSTPFKLHFTQVKSEKLETITAELQAAREQQATLESRLAAQVRIACRVIWVHGNLSTV